jgi:hypothetical protein
MSERAQSGPDSGDGHAGVEERRRGVLPMERIGVLEAVRWHWLMVVFMVLVFAAAGVAVGALRSPTYSADSRLQVEVGARTTAGIPAAVTAAQNLASTYARDIEAPAVQKRTAKAAQTSTGTVADNVAATPILDTSVVKVSASASSRGEAIALANAGSKAMKRFVALRNGSTEANTALSGNARKAIADYQQAFDREKHAKHQFERSPSAEKRQALKEAEVKTQEALFSRNAAQEVFAQSQLQSTAPLKPLTPATSATSDRLSMMEILGLIGALAGFAIGVALATWRANRLVRGSWET